MLTSHSLDSPALDPSTTTIHRGLLPALPPSILYNPVLYPLAWTVLWFLMILDTGFYRLTCRPNPIARIRRDLNDTSLFSPGGRREYIFSEEDDLVPVDAVVHHAREARKKGWPRTGLNLFVGSGHCAHAMVDRERYWGIVKGLLGDGGVKNDRTNQMKSRL